MEADEIRLELIKLTYKAHEDASLTVLRARELEAYVLKDSALKSKTNQSDKQVDRENKPSRSIYNKGQPVS